MYYSNKIKFFKNNFVTDINYVTKIKVLHAKYLKLFC